MITDVLILIIQVVVLILIVNLFYRIARHFPKERKNIWDIMHGPSKLEDEPTRIYEWEPPKTEEEVEFKKQVDKFNASHK